MHHSPGPLLGGLLLLTATAARAAEPIVIDGGFGDWRDVPVAASDPADAPAAEIDLRDVHVAADGRFVHLSIGLTRAVNVQRLEGRLDIVLDGARGGATVRGLEGADLVLTFTPPGRDTGRHGMGVGLDVAGARPGATPSPYDVGFTFGPTYASDRIECRIERGRRVLGGRSVTGKIVYVGPSGAVADETDAFEAPLPALDRTRGVDDGAQPDDPLARAEGCDVRVMTWNTKLGALLKQGATARRLVAAVEPDVILVQELADTATAAEIERLLNGDGPAGEGARWRAFVGGGGGNLRCGIVTRHPIERGAAPEPIDYPGRPGRHVRTASVVVEPAGRRLLVLSAHLKCCGRIGDSSDRKREVEAGAIRSALAGALAEGRCDGLIVGGDLNLVGGYRPLEILVSGLDGDGASLRIVEPLQIDGRSNATWSDPGSPFVPGRLDYVAFSAGGLSLLHAFVLDTRDLAPRWRRHHGLGGGDAGTVSDHLPVVVDLRWSSPGPAGPS
jgi:endonuclease/exonuclease/phosphatase family metal-dependent hydrolase